MQCSRVIDKTEKHYSKHWLKQTTTQTQVACFLHESLKHLSLLTYPIQLFNPY